MRVSHKFSAEFDDDNLIATGGLVPVMLLAESAGLSELVDEFITVAGSAGANADVKVSALVAGMVAGADSISDMDLLRHGGMDRAFTEHRAPTTLGTHLRGYRFGHVRQLDAIASRLLVALAARVPALVRGADEVAYVDIDDTIRETHGYAKQGASYGYSGVRGLNALVATLSTPTAAPVIAGMRLRKGSVKSPRGVGRMIAEALAVARAAGAGGLITVRADSAFYQHDVIAAIRRGKAHFSITARMDAAVVAAISRIPEHEWVAIKYPKAIWDQEQQRWISDAEVAEVPYTAFTSRKKDDHITARLIVRRVKRLNPKSVPQGQGEMFSVLNRPGFRGGSRSWEDRTHVEAIPAGAQGARGSDGARMREGLRDTLWRGQSRGQQARYRGRKPTGVGEEHRFPAGQVRRCGPSEVGAREGARARGSRTSPRQ